METRPIASSTCLQHVFVMYIRRPLLGHQAVRRSFEVYNSIASIDRLQTSKYIALLTSMFTASFSAFKSSCNLFLCCYRATERENYPQLGFFSQNGVSPGIPQKSFEFSIFFSSICTPKMTLKTDPKSPENRVLIKIGIPLCFSLILAPQMEPTPRQQQYY